MNTEARPFILGHEVLLSAEGDELGIQKSLVVDTRSLSFSQHALRQGDAGGGLGQALLGGSDIHLAPG